MKKVSIALFIFLFLQVCLPVYAALNSQPFQYYKEVNVDTDGFNFIPLDSEVLRNTREDLADLRLCTGDGQEIPYQITPYLLPQEGSIQAQLIDQAKHENKYLLTLDLQQSGYLHNKVVLDTSAKDDYLADVKIEGSNDNKTWNFIALDKILSVQPAYKKNEVNYPSSTSRYVRLTVTPSANQSLLINTATISFRPIDTQVFQEIPSALVSREEDDKNGKSLLVIDLGVKGYYLENIRLPISGQNYRRHVALFSSNDRKEWQSIAPSEYIYYYKWADYEAVHDSIAVNNSGGRYIKLEIDNGNSPPLNIGQIQVVGNVPRLLADLKQGSYILWYGSSNASTPSYDLASFAQLIDKKNLPSVKLGLENKNEAYKAPQQAWTERNRWLLNVTIIIAVLLLGAIIVRNMTTEKNTD